ncbi:MAG: hypothetical protein IJB65_06910 [Clostridia bacterium]|nr:hypothetical protein [Clostridia bacterium]
MTYEVYRYIFMGGAILTILMLIVSVFVFFYLKIPKVIGDITGSTARKAIENIRNHNEKTGDKTFKTSRINNERGKITDKISASGKLIKQVESAPYGAMATEKLNTQQLVGSDGAANETTVLSQATASETTVLSETPVMAAAETTVLSQQSAGNEFVVEYEITYIHTDEIIA